MRVSRFFISTLKEAPSEAELPSHRLMLARGLHPQNSPAVCTPGCLWDCACCRSRGSGPRRDGQERRHRVADAYAQCSPAELLAETGRVGSVRPADAEDQGQGHNNLFCFGHTHEEVITDIARREVKSYPPLPLNFYQIQTKFRDESPSAFPAVMRAREFVMKDAYSFHSSFRKPGADLPCDVRDIQPHLYPPGPEVPRGAADTGAIGGSGSHEFQVLADSGEDGLAFCPPTRMTLPMWNWRKRLRRQRRVPPLQKPCMTCPPRARPRVKT